MANATKTYDCRPRYSDMCSDGGLFIVSTGVAGVAPGTALSTTPPLAIWNPLNSNKLATVVRVRMTYLSGTLGAGSVVYAMATQTTVPTGGVELQPQAGMIGNAGGSIRCFQGSTLAVTPSIIAPAFTLTAALATTAVQPIVVAQDEVAGELMIPPGTALVIQAVAAAGTTPLVLFGVSYVEESYSVTVT